ncbi:hypothetical protein, partial [Escherichia coli]
FVWKQNYILVDEYFFFCCTWIVNSACKKTRFVTACAQDISQQSATGKKNDCLVLFDSGKRRFKRKQNIFLRR